jgi:hypothetical protein
MQRGIEIAQRREAVNAAQRQAAVPPNAAELAALAALGPLERQVAADAVIAAQAQAQWQVRTV